MPIFIWKLHSGYRPVPAFRKQIIKDIFHFSFGNYIGDNFRLLPGFILPILIVNILNPEMGAYFYIAWMIANLLFIVSQSTGLSLLAEASYSPNKLRIQIIKAAKFIFLILLPAILLLFFFGNFLLSLFGVRYAEEALKLLWLLALSSIPLAVNELYVSVNRIHKKIKPVIYVYTFIALATIGSGYLLLKVMGISGIGVAWLTSNTMVMMVVLTIMLRGNKELT